MGYVDVVKDRVLDLAGKAVEHANGTGAVNPQTVTIDCSVDQARQLWCDPQQLSVVLGDIADVARTSDGDYRWEMRQAPLPAADGSLRRSSTTMVSASPAWETVTTSPSPSNCAALHTIWALR
jgi:hypothetical protein